MVIKPISKQLLPHTVTYSEYEGVDSWEDEIIYSEPITVNNVRVQYNSRFNQTADSENKTYNALMFVDVVNTSPQVDFVEESKVVFDGKEMFITEIEPVYADALHHLEVKLV